MIFDAIKTMFLNHSQFFISAAVSIVLLGLTFLLRPVVLRLVFTNLRRITDKTAKKLPRLFLDALERPAGTMLTLAGIYLSAVNLSFTSTAFDLWFKAACLKLLRICIIGILTWGMARFISPQTFSSILPGRSNEPMGKTFCLFFARIAEALIVIFGIVIIINELGYDVGGLITGIGLGGLTIALAAQDWASNLFGGAVILFDKPFAVDDWIQADSTLEGIVEDITFRTTRIRTFDNAQIIVPNALLVSKPITNWSRMEKRKVSFDIGLTYDSPAEKITCLVEQIKCLLRETPDINQDMFSVTFNEFAASSLNIRIHYFTSCTDYVSYMRTKEHINYKITEQVQNLGLSFAFPTQTLYIENPGAQDKETAR